MARCGDHDREIAALRAQAERLKHALGKNAVVDQAIGVVITYGGVDAETGRQVLEEVSRRTNAEPAQVAEHLVRWPRRTWLPSTLHQALDATLERARSSASRADTQDRSRPASAP
ncbi:ANTAR domain-containing protein [Streptomyces sp. IBSBF 3136]|uniref:ANTAR domain-containing protein n=1 Tax=Streptomyces sp. IBSBF 3136 TaxID=2903524 RepID=UPI002FDBFCC7